MNTRNKLALIFGTPIAIALIMVWIYQAKVQEALESADEPIASDKSQETIIKEAPFHQGESDQRIQPEAKKCIITGCNFEICAGKNIETECEYKSEYSCYHNATCERQSDSKCGWTMADWLKRCLQQKSKNTEEWLTYQHPIEGYLYDYPAHDTTENLIPLEYFAPPHMEIWVEEDGEIDDILKERSDIDYLEFEEEEVEINGLQGKIFNEIYTAGPWIGARCPVYRLKHKNKVYEFRLYECLDWKYFDDVVKSFRFP
jgi:hypothetical protein